MRASAVLLLLVLFTGCSYEMIPPQASAALRSSITFELFSLDPDKKNKEVDDATETFHGWTVLGSTEVPAGDSRNSLLDGLDKAVAEHDRSVAACFDPRHGIRVIHEGKQYDFLICFRCHQTKWFVDDVENGLFLISKSPKPLFDKVLRDASVSLPPKR